MCLSEIGPVVLEICGKITAWLDVQTTRLVRCDRRCTSSSHFASVAVLVVTSCDNPNSNISASFQLILLLFVANGVPRWGILFFIIIFRISKIFCEGGPKIRKSKKCINVFNF